MTPDIMKYNFDEIIDRRHTDSSKWKWYPPDVLPMWVADMDFRAPEPVLARLREMVAHGIFGYEFPPPEWFSFVCERMDKLYGWAITPEMVVTTPGVVSGFNVAALAVCGPGSALLMQPPVYFPFLHVHENNGLQRQFAPLTAHTNSRSVRYELDFDVFESAFTPETRLFLLCHPHNPTGQVYTRDELARLAEICLRHNVAICSDEIHSELLLGGAGHVPLAMISPEVEQRTITLIAPSKTFNLAGLFCSFAIIPNLELRERYKKVCEQQILHSNSFGLAAAKAAFQHGDEWLAELRAYLTANRDALVDYVRDCLSGMRAAVPDATYLAWLDCRDLNLQPSPFEFFLKEARVALGDGAMFGPGGEGFVRLNFGCPRAMLMDGLERMRMALVKRVA
ncbi:MAG: MalY/PatB family protein [Anaerolineales bacterium]